MTPNYITMLLSTRTIVYLQLNLPQLFHYLEVVEVAMFYYYYYVSKYLHKNLRENFRYDIFK